jgi:hypothetical protein
MPEITRTQLHAYLDDALDDRETAEVERALRESESLRKALRAIMQERDRGEHTLGAIWRRFRLTCPSRELLGSFLLQVLDGDQQEYVEFHLRTVNCPFCLANLADLQLLQKEAEPETRQRRQRIFESSHGYLNVCQDPKS